MRAGTFFLLLVLSFSSAGAASGEEKKDEDWHGKLDLGVSLAIGSTDSVTATVTGEAIRKWDQNELDFDLIVAYGLTSIDDRNAADGTDTDATTADLQTLLAGYKRFFENEGTFEKIYWYLDGEVGRNNVQDIQYYTLVDTGPGLRVWETGPKSYWDVELGVGYRYENYQLPSINDTLEDRSTINGRLSSEFRRAFEVVHVGLDAAFYLPFNLPEAWFARGGAFLDVPLGNGWKIGNALRVNYLNQPPDGAERINLLFTVALGYVY